MLTTSNGIVTYTWAEVKDQIRFRLNRPELNPDFVDLMARERAEFYAPNVFFQGETTDYSITFQPGQYFYPLPAGTQKVIDVRFLLGSVTSGIWYPVRMIDHYEDILHVDLVQPPIQSIPSWCRVYGNQLRIFPTPNASYQAELSIEGKIECPLNDPDSNFWCQNGRVLLIESTMLAISEDFLGPLDAARAAELRPRVTAAEQKLLMQTHEQLGPFIIRGHI